MKRAPFRLERVLRVRRLLEEEARATWLAAESRARDSEVSAGERLGTRDDALQQLGRELEDLSPSEMLWQHTRIDGMTREVVVLRERARTLRTQADQALAPFEERRRERRGLERLRERDRKRSFEAARRAEATERDEISIQRVARKRRLHSQE